MKTKHKTLLNGFYQVKNNPKIQENSEVGGWVKPQLVFLFFCGNIVFLVFFVLFSCLQKIDRVGGCMGCLKNPSFSRFFIIFIYLDKTPKYNISSILFYFLLLSQVSIRNGGIRVLPIEKPSIDFLPWAS